MNIYAIFSVLVRVLIMHIGAFDLQSLKMYFLGSGYKTATFKTATVTKQRLLQKKIF